MKKVLVAYSSLLILEHPCLVSGPVSHFMSVCLWSVLMGLQDGVRLIELELVPLCMPPSFLPRTP